MVLCTCTDRIWGTRVLSWYMKSKHFRTCVSLKGGDLRHASSVSFRRRLPVFTEAELF